MPPTIAPAQERDPNPAAQAQPLTPGAAKKRMLVIVNPYATTVSDRLKNLVVYALQARYEVEAIDTEASEHAIEIGREAGHGEPITDHAALIEERFALHQRRAEKLYGLIAEQPRTGHELAQALWGNVAVTQAFLTLSEVIGHLDLLVNEGAARELEDGEVVRYQAT